jgi:eukaryotic-like serine/threonine-protein kinase
VLRFGIEIADALDTAHKHGIVHRDLKPGNIMLTPSGTKLLDFGLAKHTMSAAGQALSMFATAPGTGTAQGTIIGTLRYMAPEQVQGSPADARTDIFALGTILYEMATGRRAFEAKTQASLTAKILETDVPAVSTVTPVAPPSLDHVVQSCLAKEPANRWQTAHDVKLELQWIQAEGSRPPCWVRIEGLTEAQNVGVVDRRDSGVCHRVGHWAGHVVGLQFHP